MHPPPAEARMEHIIKVNRIQGNHIYIFSIDSKIQEISNPLPAYTVCISSSLPPFFPPCLPSCRLPSSMPSFFPPSLPVCLPTCLPLFIPASLLSSLPASSHVCIPSVLYVLNVYASALQGLDVHAVNIPTPQLSIPPMPHIYNVFLMILKISSEN